MIDGLVHHCDPLDKAAVGINVHPRGIEHQPDIVAREQKILRHARGEFDAADADAGETDTAEIVDALDLRRQKLRRGRRNMDEFGTNADFDCARLLAACRSCGRAR